MTKKSTFILPDSGKSSVPCVELHYYNWLLETKASNIHKINTKRAYLDSLGFIVGVDKISEDDISILRAVDEIYFFNEILPTIDRIL